MMLFMQRLTQEQRQKAGGGAAVGVGVFFVWLLGYVGVRITSEVGVVIGGLVVGVTSAIWAEGLKGVFVHIWSGEDHDHRHTAPTVEVETETPAKVTVVQHEGEPPANDEIRELTREPDER